MPKLAEPKKEGFLDPWNDHTLLAYYKKLYYWHGFLRFLGLPHLEDNPDVPIESLYVEPSLSEEPISPDEPPEDWPSCTGLLQALKEHPRLVILGDPGLGKSSLVNWVVHQLTRMEGRAWRQELGDLVPIPMILRELPIDEEITWDGLVRGFLERPAGEPLRGHGDLLKDLLERGQVLFLLDGIDELGASAPREALRRALLEGVDKHPRCRFLLTSRIVGYEEVSFDREEAPASELEELPIRAAKRARKGKDRENLEHPFDRRYLAPFDDEQIERFVRAWYGRREGRKEERESTAQDLLAALRQHESTERLARVPNLLTLMALIFRIQLQLPDGRALLYDKIAEAYLESIDRYRGMAVPGARLTEKKRWLARVGFEMQLRRQQKAQERSKVVEAIRRQALLGEAEILVDQATVERWLAEAMAESPRSNEELDARTFLDYVGRRSGLLLPRGEGQYAFTHLSFQEYFAAVHMAEILRSPEWMMARQAPGLSECDLPRYAGSSVWQETLVFLFELLADARGWPRMLAGIVFGNDLSGLNEDDSQKAELLTQLLIDPHTNWPDELRLAAARGLWRVELDWQEKDGQHRFMASPVLRAATSPTNNWLHLVLPEVVLEQPRRYLKLVGAAAERMLPYLRKLPSLQLLWLDEAPIRDLRPLGNLYQLQNLSLDGTQAQDLRPLANLRQIQNLWLGRTWVEDLRPLDNLRQLRGLSLFGTRVQDIRPLENLRQLRSLNLGHTHVQDLQPLENLHQLRDLRLDRIQAQNLRPLENLHQLETLGLLYTQVQDLSPLHGVKSLQQLWLDHRVPDHQVKALQKALPNLQVFRE